MMRRIALLLLIPMLALYGCSGSSNSAQQVELRPSIAKLRTLKCSNGRQKSMGFYINEQVCSYNWNTGDVERLTRWQASTPLSSRLTDTVTKPDDLGFTMTSVAPNENGNPVISICSVNGVDLELDRFVVVTDSGPAPLALALASPETQVSIKDHLEVIQLEKRSCTNLRVFIDLSSQSLRAPENTFALGYAAKDMLPIGQVIKLRFAVPKQATRGTIPTTTGRFF